MDTAERRQTAGDGGAAQLTVAQRAPEARDSDIPAVGDDTEGARGLLAHAGAPEAGHGLSARAGGPATPCGSAAAGDEQQPGVAAAHAAQEQPYYKPLWVEEPARRRRLPDPVREAAVRAVLIIAVTLIQAVVAFLCTMAGSWLAFPMVLSSVASTVVATWAALDVWVTRQVWNQRNGVVSTPSSTARALRRERRRTRREERAAERAQERIRRRGGTGQLSHS
ncbi:hypothetical protein ABZV31_27925 [Streptomyces sp. NPDC005202]|uniref:hypothetical protein n=1 Tax=Streptomyces sp. NPDC005202 TaxID=3157021 RepID=UPI0033B5523F